MNEEKLELIENGMENNEEKFSLKSEILSWIKAIIFAAIFAFILNNFILVNAKVPSGSMEPTIQVNDRVIAFRFSYIFSEPRRFDIIVFNVAHSYDLYIKRIIGLPGETVMIHGGFVYIDGVRLINDTFADELIFGNAGPFIAGEDQFFVLGDHRNNSQDSRDWPNTFVEADDIVGRAAFKYFRGFEIFERKAPN